MQNKNLEWAVSMHVMIDLWTSSLFLTKDKNKRHDKVGGKKTIRQKPYAENYRQLWIQKMGEIVFHREEHTTDDIWITKSSAMKASKKSTANVKQGRDSMNKLPPNSTWQKYHLWFMFQYMNFGRAYYLLVLLISVRSATQYSQQCRCHWEALCSR